MTPGFQLQQGTWAPSKYSWLCEHPRHKSGRTARRRNRYICATSRTFPFPPISLLLPLASTASFQIPHFNQFVTKLPSTPG
ncbi:hypothetical protein BDZ91DRAFT_382443 [Kalaharituber pfeilii]|nr:hypothetical protein BDZ91DRAFT_382443 [Kalaharituber pfeilii]